jgi:hypothetical protein
LNVNDVNNLGRSRPLMPSAARPPFCRNTQEASLLKFCQLPTPYAICQLPATDPIPDWTTLGEFTSITRTPAELSIVCPESNLPAGIKADRGWICLQLQGPFPFSETGILSSFLAPLSANAIPIFAISTYETDYVLIQQPLLGKALETLRHAGHVLL